MSKPHGSSKLKDTANLADIEGSRIKQLNGGAAIWLILDGQRRQIIDMNTFFDLFGHTGTDDVLDADSIPDGGYLGPSPVLAKANSGDSNTYLITDGHKRPVLDKAKYGFDKGTVHLQENGVIQAIPTGDNIPKS